MCGFFKSKPKTLDKELEATIKNNFVYFNRDNGKPHIIYASYAVTDYRPFATIDTKLKIAFYHGEYFSFDLQAIEPNAKKDLKDWCKGPDHMKKIGDIEGKSYATSVHSGRSVQLTS